MATGVAGRGSEDRTLPGKHQIRVTRINEMQLSDLGRQMAAGLSHHGVTADGKSGK